MLQQIGKMIFCIGIISLFRKVDGHCGFGGCVNNADDILWSSLVIMIIGFILLQIGKKIEVIE